MLYTNIYKHIRRRLTIEKRYRPLDDSRYQMHGRYRINRLCESMEDIEHRLHTHRHKPYCIFDINHQVLLLIASRWLSLMVVLVRSTGVSKLSLIPIARADSLSTNVPDTTQHSDAILLSLLHLELEAVSGRRAAAPLKRLRNSSVAAVKKNDAVSLRVQDEEDYLKCTLAMLKLCCIFVG